jgi:hypothetical protein
MRFFTTHGKKATDVTGAKRRVTAFAVRQHKNARQSLAFAVRHSLTRTAITYLFAVHHRKKRTAK